MSWRFKWITVIFIKDKDSDDDEGEDEDEDKDGGEVNESQQMDFA